MPLGRIGDGASISNDQGWGGGEIEGGDEGGGWAVSASDACGCE